MNAAAPACVVVIAGTSTGVGKTWVTVELARRLHASGRSVAARKPVQSFDPDDAAGADSQLLAAATGEPDEVVCPPHRSYPMAMAPPIAADVLQRPRYTVGDLLAELGASWPAGVEVGLVELAGGPRSPMAHDGDGVDLVQRLRPDVCVLVADAGLGAINAVRLSRDAFDRDVVVLLNRYEPASAVHRRNREWLGAFAGLRVMTTIDQLAAEVTP